LENLPPWAKETGQKIRSIGKEISPFGGDWRAATRSFARKNSHFEDRFSSFCDLEKPGDFRVDDLAIGVGE